MMSTRSRPKLMEHAKCTMCAGVDSPGFYTGCMVKDGHAADTGWSCDGKGNLTRPVVDEPVEFKGDFAALLATGTILHDYEDEKFATRLMKDGTFYVTVKSIARGNRSFRCPWYSDEKGRPWLVAKRRSFVSLTKQMIREGDFDDLVAIK